MSELPLVSVIIPLYNHAAYVEECLDSVLNSHYPHLEVLVLDDGSSDDSYDRVTLWRERHRDAFNNFQLMRQENQGITKTLNTLVSQARGQLLTLLASDDALLPNGVRTRVDALNEHPEWLAVFGDCVVVDEKSRLLYSSSLADLYPANKAALADPRFIKEELVIRWCVPGPVFMARKEAYDVQSGVGLYDPSSSVEDRDFYLRLLAKNSLGFLDRPVATYRVHTHNAFKNPQRRLQHLRSMERVEQKHLKNFRGLAKVALWLKLQDYRSIIALETNRTLVARARGWLARGGLRLIYRLHTLQVRNSRQV